MSTVFCQLLLEVSHIIQISIRQGCLRVPFSFSEINYNPYGILPLDWRKLSVRLWQTVSRLCFSRANRFIYVISIGKDVDTSKLAVFHLNTFAVEDENLILKADIEFNFGTYSQRKSIQPWGNASLTALFGSTWLCQSAFSHMKIIL